MNEMGYVVESLWVQTDVYKMAWLRDGMILWGSWQELFYIVPICQQIIGLQLSCMLPTSTIADTICPQSYAIWRVEWSLARLKTSQDLWFLGLC